MNPTSDNRSNPSINETEHNGSLEVQTYTAKRTYPVPHAEVTISRETSEGEVLLFRGETDASGKIPPIVLPGVKAIDTLSPRIDFKNIVSNNSYKITVSHPHFSTMIYYNVPVYEGILSIQSVDMVPKSVAADPSKPIEFKEQSFTI